MKFNNGIIYTFILICLLTSGFIVFFPEEAKTDPPLFLYDYLNNRMLYLDGYNNTSPTVFRQKTITKHISFDTFDEGLDIYSPSKMGYRYGPSIIQNSDNSYDIFYSSVGNNSTEWDYIRYVHMDQNYNCSKEKIVLKPTHNSMDNYSTCDPGVIYFNGYYYLAYTSTQTKSGNNNSIFIARSKKVDGPYEKWNGSGWGGKPYPVIKNENNDDYFGIGEPSFVIKDTQLFMYYSSHTYVENATRVALFDLCDDWPSTLQYTDSLIPWEYGNDSFDVVYLEDLDKFVAFTVFYRMNRNTEIGIYESKDGINFNFSHAVGSGILHYAHNLGISKSKDGHALFSEPLLLSYAHSPEDYNKWGRWALCVQNIQLKQIEREE